MVKEKEKMTSDLAEEADAGTAVSSNKKWYVIRVQTGKEDAVKETLEKRTKALDFSDRVGRVVIPSEKISEIKGGKKRIRERKIYPGYIMVEMELTDDVWFFIRETPGIGDFLGTTRPTPMAEHEVNSLLSETDATGDNRPKLKINFKVNDNVRIKDGPFENFDGVVKEINPHKGIVKVIVMIFGRPTPVELEYWQIEVV